MANIKFSEFTVANAVSDIGFVVGYKNGANVQITPSILLVELYYNNAKKLETTSTGVNITGEVRVTGAYYDSSNLPGTTTQVLSSTATGTSWVDQSALVSGSAERVSILVKNGEGTALVKGDPVYIIGSVGASARLEVGLCDASDPDKMPCVGLLEQDLLTNGQGSAVTAGKLKNLITTPIDGQPTTENETIYVKAGGSSGSSLTTTKPTGSTNLIQNVGQVGRVSSSSDGNFVVSAIMRTNDVPNLPEGRIWVGDGNTIVSDTVYLDETNERMGIGTTSPAEKLDVNGTVNLTNLKIATAQGTDGQVLTSTGSGIAWEDAGGGGATELNDLTDVSIESTNAAFINIPSNGMGDYCLVIGKGADNSMTTGAFGTTIIGQYAGETLAASDYGVYIGAFAGRYQNTTTAEGNVLIGYEAGQGSASTTTNSYATVAIGHQALKNVTGGDRNVAIGYSALSNNLTGGTTVAIGVECGKGLTTSSNNIFMGYQAAENTNASNSVIIGYQAMDTGAATNMSNATVVGYQAARSATSQRATAFGAQAAYSQTTASNSVTIGASAGYNNTSSGDRTIVGYAAARYNTAAGNAAFGNQALQGPASATGVTGGYNTAIGRQSMRDLTTGYFNTAIGNQSAQSLLSGFYNTMVGSEAGDSKTAGNNCVMLGYNAQPSTATVSNEITLGNVAINVLRCQVTSITSLSDKRDKTKIEESNYGLNVIDKLKPVTFDWNTRDGAKVGVKDLGFIAQDLQEVDDENLKLVYDINPEKLEASYGRLIPVLVKAIQELKAEIEILKS